MVEANVGRVGRKLFVPRPSVWNLEGFNERLPDRCLSLGDKTHWRKGKREADLFAEDRKALMPLPDRPFDVVRWERMKSDEYGCVTLEGRHRYSADPGNAGREVIVGLRALEIEILDAGGRHIATHPRAYGDAPTDSSDPSRQLGLLCNRPNARPNSRVREALPDPLREWLDSQGETVRRESLQTLKRTGRDNGWDNAVGATPPGARGRRGRRQGRRPARRGRDRRRRGGRLVRRAGRSERTRPGVRRHRKGVVMTDDANKPEEPIPPSCAPMRAACSYPTPPRTTSSPGPRPGRSTPPTACSPWNSPTARTTNAPGS